MVLYRLWYGIIQAMVSSLSRLSLLSLSLSLSSLFSLLFSLDNESRCREPLATLPPPLARNSRTIITLSPSPLLSLTHSRNRPPDPCLALLVSTNDLKRTKKNRMGTTKPPWKGKLSGSLLGCCCFHFLPHSKFIFLKLTDRASHECGQIEKAKRSDRQCSRMAPSWDV